MEREADIDDLAAILLDVNPLDASRDPRFCLGIMCFLGSIALVSLLGSILWQAEATDRSNDFYDQ